jgi:hypothetical protein
MGFQDLKYKVRVFDPWANSWLNSWSIREQADPKIKFTFPFKVKLV